MRIPALVVIVVLLAFSAPAVAQEELSPAEELLAMERLREEVEAAFRLCTEPPEDRHDQQSGCRETVRRLVAIGPEVVPFVDNELAQETPLLDFIALEVLGRLPSKKTATLLREAVQRFDRAEPSTRTRNLKIWALLGLALHGDPIAVDLGNSGRLNVGMDRNRYLRTPILAVLAILTAPDSRSRLMKQLELYAEGDRYLDQLLAATAALSQVAAPETFPALDRLATHEEWPIRIATVDGFRRLGDPRSVERLIRLLNEDPDRRVRMGAATALARMKPVKEYGKLLAALETETFYPIRGRLYKAAAQIGGDKAVPALLRFRGSPDPGDRRVLVEALGWTGSSRALPAIQQGLNDPDNTVAFAALAALDRIGTPAAVDSLLAAMTHANSGVATTAARLLVERDETRAAPRIASRLLTDLLAGDADPLQRDPVRLLCDALVDLRHTPARKGLLEALERQTDVTIRETIQETINVLNMIESGGDRIDYWAGLLEHENHAVHAAAVANLGRIGGSKAVARLMARFDDSDLEGQIEIVRNLHQADVGQVGPFLERILLDDRFDPPWFGSLRATAAWTAARIGGDRMVRLLKQASREVEGTNLFYLLYLMKASGEAGIAEFEAMRIPRLRVPHPWRWQESKVLDEVVDELQAGFRHPLLDTPPEHVAIQHQ